MTQTILTSIAVLLRIIANPVANVFQKDLTAKGTPPLFINFITYLLLAIFCMFIAEPARMYRLPASFWIYSIAGGIAGASGNGFLVKALEKGELSVLGPINSYKSVIGMIVGAFLLREIPSLGGLAGVVLIIAGSYFVLDTTADRFSWALIKRTEIQYRVWAMILTAMEAVFIKKVIVASSFLIAFISWCWFGAVFSCLFLLSDGLIGKVKSPAAKDISRYIYLVICVGVMQATTIYAFDHMPVGYALSLFQLSTIVSVLLGHAVFKEQNIRKKLIGSAIMVVGSVLIILLKDKQA